MFPAVPARGTGELASLQLPKRPGSYCNPPTKSGIELPAKFVFSYSGSYVRLRHAYYSLIIAVIINKTRLFAESLKLFIVVVGSSAFEVSLD